MAAVPVEEYHWYNAETTDDDEAEDVEPRLVSCGRARFGMKDYGVADGWGEDFAGDADDADEILVVDELSDTGELYDVEEFNRLLAEDAALAAEGGEADDAEEPGDPEPADELEAIDDSEPVDDTGEEESATERS